MLAWIGIALLSVSWLVGLGYFRLPSGLAWTAAVAAGTFCLVSLRPRLPDWKAAAALAVLALPAALIAPWPYAAIFVLLVAGGALCVLVERPGWLTAAGVGLALAAAVALALLLPGNVARCGQVCTKITHAPWQARVIAVAALGLLATVCVALAALRPCHWWGRRLSFAWLVGGCVLLAQAGALVAYEALTARSHLLPAALARLVGAVVGWLGIESAVKDGAVILYSIRKTHVLAATWELLLDPVTLGFLAGGLALVACRAFGARRDHPLRWWIVRLAGMGLLTALWLPLRSGLLAGLFLHDVLRTEYEAPLDAMGVFWNGWVLLALQLPLVVLAWRLLPACGDDAAAPGEPACETSPRRRRLIPALATVAVLLGVAAVAAGVFYDRPGPRKHGRVVIEEYHPRGDRQWERTDREFHTTWYGHLAAYNYWSIVDYARRFYDVTRHTDLLHPDALAECDVLIVKVPTRRFTAKEIEAVRKYVEDGGGLLLIGEHTNVFGTGESLNSLARIFGFRFRYDCLFGIEKVFEQPVFRPLVPHPILRGLEDPAWTEVNRSASEGAHRLVLARPGAFDFATSCSIEPLGEGRAPMRYAGLKNLLADYHVDNYYGRPENVADMHYGAFVQMWSTRYGKGRVVGFTDSTVFSNFSAFDPGKKELWMGMIEWLNHRSPGVDPRPWLVWLGVLGGLAGLALARSSGAPWPVLLGAGILGWTLSVPAVNALHRWEMPAPRADRVDIVAAADRTPTAAEREERKDQLSYLNETQRQREVEEERRQEAQQKKRSKPRRYPLVQVNVDRGLSDVILPKNGFIDILEDGFGVFEQWILRLGYFTSRQAGAGLFENFPAPDAARVALFLYPHKPVTAELKDRLKAFLDDGGHAIVVDSPANGAGFEKLRRRECPMQVVCATAQGAIQAWDAQGGRRVFSVAGQTGAIDAVALSPDGWWLVSGGRDGMVRISDAVTGEELAVLKGHAGPVNAVAFSPDGQWIASAGDDGTVRVWPSWRGSDARETATLTGHAGAVRGLAFNPAGTKLASAGADRTVKLWDFAGICKPDDRRKPRTLEADAAGLTCLAFAADGRRVAVGNDRGTITIWDAESERTIRRIEAHDGPVAGVAFNFTGLSLVSAGRDGAVNVWNSVQGDLVCRLADGNAMTLFGAVLGNSLGGPAAGLGGACAGRAVDEAQSNRGPLHQVAVSSDPEDTRVAAACDDGAVRLWRLAEGGLVRVFQGGEGPVLAVACSPKMRAQAPPNPLVRRPVSRMPYALLLGMALVATLPLAVAALAGRPRPWFARGDGAPLPAAALVFFGGALGWIAYAALAAPAHEWVRENPLLPHSVFGPSADTIVMRQPGQESSTANDLLAAYGIQIKRRAGPCLAGQLESSLVRGSPLAFSPDGRYVAAETVEKKIKLFDAVTGREAATLEGSVDGLRGLAFSPDGGQIAAATREHAVPVWDAATGKRVMTLSGHTESVWSVAFGGDWIATGSGDGTARLWEAATGKPHFVLPGHPGIVRSVAFSPDARWLVSAGDGGTPAEPAAAPREEPAGRDASIRVWDLKSQPLECRTLRYTSRVHAVAFSSDGTRLVSGSDDRTTRIWDAAQGTPLCVIEGRDAQGHDAEVLGVAFSPDGKHFASASRDGSVKLFDSQSFQPIAMLARHAGPARSVVFSPDGLQVASAGDDRVAQIHGTSGAKRGRLAEDTGEPWPAISAEAADEIVGGAPLATIRGTPVGVHQKVGRRGGSLTVLSYGDCFNNLNMMTGFDDTAPAVERLKVYEWEFAMLRGIVEDEWEALWEPPVAKPPAADEPAADEPEAKKPAAKGPAPGKSGS